MTSDWNSRYSYAVEKGNPLTTRQAAKYLGVSPRTLEGNRKNGTGPAWRYRYVPRGSGPVVYERTRLDAFLPGGINDYYTTAEAATVLDKSTRTLEDWREKEKGPPWIRPWLRVVLYRRTDVVDFE